MEELTALAKLLGEENEKRLKEEVTDILIDYIKTDLENTGMYLVDFEELTKEVASSIQEEIKEKYAEILRNNVEKKLQELMK